ncbi:MAG TPA: hypothetical protein DDW52_18020 [Planctomycetaceae bacterium]|nr:hypothetical protein [Planctomycetaceae bacterium]
MRVPQRRSQATSYSLTSFFALLFCFQAGALLAETPCSIPGVSAKQAAASPSGITRHIDAVPRAECFPIESLPEDLQTLSRELLLEALDSEALYTFVGGIKPISEGFWSEYFQVSPPDITQLGRARRAMEAWRCGRSYDAGVLVFENLRAGQRYGSAWIVDRESLKRKIAEESAYFGRLGISDATSPEVVLLSVERAKQAAERWRGFGLVFGYPKNAIDFFVRAGEHQSNTGEFVRRDFRSYPTHSSSSYNFVYAVPRFSEETDAERELRRRVDSILNVYTAHRDRYIKDEDPRRVVELVRDWFDDGNGWCHSDHALQKATMWGDARRWAEEDGIRLKTASPEQPLEDLEQLDSFLASPRIVALGESTHGTREIFQMKHRVFRYLVEKHGVRLFGIEASYAACLPIDAYVVTGLGDPREAIAGQGFWTWDTEEVLALVEWMRAWNQRRPEGESPLRFYGFDTQDAYTPLKMVLAEVQDFAPNVHDEFTELLKVALEEQYGDSLNSAPRTQLQDLLVAIDKLSEFCGNVEGVTQSKKEQLELLLLQAKSAVQTEVSSRDRWSSMGVVAEVDLYSRIRKKISAIDAWASTLEGDHGDALREFVRSADDLAECQMKFRDEMDNVDRERWRRAVTWAREVADSDERKKAVADLEQFLVVSTEYLDKPRELSNARDETMATMVERILQQHGTGSRIALWAHDWHISKFAGNLTRHVPRMGTFLEQRFADDYLPIGISFGTGAFQAKYYPQDDEDPAKLVLREFRVSGSRNDSFSNVFDYSDSPVSAFDLTDDGVNALPAWMRQPQYNRTIGAVFRPELEKSDSYYEEMEIAAHYELVLHIKKTSRARPLGPVARFRFGAKFEESDEGSKSDSQNLANGGARINSVAEKSLAELCGLKSGDRIVGIEDEEIVSASQFKKALAEIDRPGSYKLSVVRTSDQLKGQAAEQRIFYLLVPQWIAD